MELSDSLQESAGVVESNLTIIVARLPERDVSVETVKQAVAREVRHLLPSHLHTL